MTAQSHDWTPDDLPVELRRAIDLAVSRGARAPVVLRVTELAGYTDWVVLVSGRSDRQVQAICEVVEVGLSADGRKPLGTDGVSEGDVVVSSGVFLLAAESRIRSATDYWEATDDAR